jgi:hypothetical protein
MGVNKSRAGKAWGLLPLGFFIALFAVLFSCEMYGYGELGGTDQIDILKRGDFYIDGEIVSLHKTDKMTTIITAAGNMHRAHIKTQDGMGKYGELPL